MEFIELTKLSKGDAVAVVSPSFAAPGKWPHVHELGLSRLKDVFGLDPVEYPTTRQLGANKMSRAQDLVTAFEDGSIRGVIASLGGNDQVTYIKHLRPEPFKNNPKPFYGYSDNTHLMNFLWLNGVPSFYGANLFTQFAEPIEIHPFTLKYLQHALFTSGETEIEPSYQVWDGQEDINWDNPNVMQMKRQYSSDHGWFWDGSESRDGVTWGGCLESIDELLRHGITIPSLKDFESIVLLTETSEEIPSSDYVKRVYRALGERGILERIQAVLVGRPKAWDFDKQTSHEQKDAYRSEQMEKILTEVRHYNSLIPVVQNLDFGHTEPQIPMPYGGKVRVDSNQKKIFVTF
jgi:muramoyltetrapeptide carboxypeptidase LdcA involved in peptidoglycan recycling